MILRIAWATPGVLNACKLYLLSYFQMDKFTWG